MRKTVAVGVRFLDNVLDRTTYPLQEQTDEAHDKRRIGLSVTGLANMLQMLGLRYGSPDGNKAVETVMREIRDTSYLASVDLAKERGAFPLFDKDAYLARPFVKGMPEEVRDGIAEHGIRNGVLMTVAPTGTTSLLYGNLSSGIEPPFDFRYFRNILQSDGSTREVAVMDWGFERFCELVGTPDYDKHGKPRGLPNYMVTALELSVEDHVAVQAACQKYIDASISKTINCASDMSFESFEKVYWLAYESGRKGCTTYRESPVRGRVQSTTSSKRVQQVDTTPSVEPTRPGVLDAKVYKLPWSPLDTNVYVTISDLVEPDGSRWPYEIFINLPESYYQEWVNAFTLTLSSVCRHNREISSLVEKLIHVKGASAWVQAPWITNQAGSRRPMPSLVAMIALTIQKHLSDLKVSQVDVEDIESVNTPQKALRVMTGEPCPRCGDPSFVHLEGCGNCLSCGYNTCG